MWSRCLLVLLLSLASIQHTYVLAESSFNDSELDSVIDDFSEDETDQSVDELLDDFDEGVEAEKKAADTANAAMSAFQLNGSLILSSSYNYAHNAPSPGETDHRGLSRLRGTFKLELKTKLSDSWQGYVETSLSHDLVYQIQGRSDYSHEQLDSQESEAELGEAWLQGNLARSLDVKLGRQLVVWGKSDNLRVTDVLNPMDQRELGLVDIEDLRLPLTMMRMDYYQGDWNLTGIAIQEIRFHKKAQFGSDFYTGSAVALSENTPNHSSSNFEYAMALNGTFSGWDLSFYWARIFDDLSHQETKAGITAFEHSRITMVGAATNIALGNWLLKSEVGHFSGLEFTAIPNQKKHRTDLLVGVEYSGFNDTTLSLEVVDRHLHNYESALATQGIKKDEWQTAFRYSGEFMHARLTITFLTLLFGTLEDGGGTARLQGYYEWTENIRLIGGVVAYHGGDKRPFTHIADNDRLFLDVKYSF